MSICNSICKATKDCLLKTALCLYKQPYIKDAVNYALIKYDEYCESSESNTVELSTKTEMDTSELDDLLADLDCDLKMD